MTDENNRDYEEGVPTEEGYFYAVICEGWKIPFPKLVFVYQVALFTLDDYHDWELFTKDVIAYQKVTPYKGILLALSNGKHGNPL